jgi:hypothetical protein
MRDQRARPRPEPAPQGAGRTWRPGHGQAQVLPVLQRAVLKDRLEFDAANRYAKRVGRERDAPTGRFPKHTDRGDQDRAVEPLHGRRCPLGHSKEEPADETGYQAVQTQPPAPRRFDEPLGLQRADLGVDLSHRLVIGGANDPLQDDGLALPPSLHPDRHVDVIKQDEPIPPIAIGVHVLVLVDRPGAAVHDETGEG